LEPKWATLASDLRAQIAGDDQNQLLPSEAELGARYGMSRGTVRRALDALEAEGLVASAQGQKRKIRQEKRWQWPMNTWERSHNASEDAWASAIRTQGGKPRTDISVSIEPALKDVATALKIASGETIAVRRRIRYVNEIPHQFADSFFPYSIASENPVFLEPGDQSAVGGLLAAAGYIQERFMDRIEARMPTPDEVRILRLGNGVPLLIHHRTGYVKSGRAVRHMISRMGADRVEITYEVDA
jgi:GntR family transcriptional regulator